jgi:hypothetical protein
MSRDYSLDGQLPNAHQRRPEYVRDDDWIRKFLRRGQIAHIASLWDDQSFVTPSIYWYDEIHHRLIFHSNVMGRIRANIERCPNVSTEVSELGRFLPSNVALEFSLQFRSVVVFGTAHLIGDQAEQRLVMHQLIAKYFPQMKAGGDYRFVTDQELKRTSVYEIRISAWSGKENWKDRADQSDEWPALNERLFE